MGLSSIFNRPADSGAYQAIGAGGKNVPDPISFSSTGASSSSNSGSASHVASPSSNPSKISSTNPSQNEQGSLVSMVGDSLKRGKRNVIDFGRKSFRYAEAASETIAAKTGAFYFQYELSKIPGVQIPFTIVNISEISTFVSENEQLKKEAQKRVTRTRSKAMHKAAIINEDQEFKPSKKGICAGIRAGIAKIVIYEGKSACEAAEKYKWGADVYAEGFQAVYSITEFLFHSVESIKDHLESLNRFYNSRVDLLANLANHVAYVLDEVWMGRKFADRSRLIDNEDWVHASNRSKYFSYLYSSSEPIIDVAKIPLFHNVEQVNSVINELKQIIQDPRLTLTEFQKRVIKYSIALLYVVVNNKSVNDINCDESVFKIIKQLQSEYIDLGVAQYLNIADDVSISKTANIHSSAFFEDNNAFFSQFANLQPGFYGVNFETGNNGHAICLNVKHEGNGNEIIDPNGVCVICSDFACTIKVLNEILKFYELPGETSVTRDNPDKSYNHRASIYLFEKAPVPLN